MRLDRIPPPRRFTMSWCAGLAEAADNATLYSEYITDLIARVKEHVALGFEGGD